MRPPSDPEKRGLVRRSVAYFGQANDQELLRKLEFEEGEDDGAEEEVFTSITVAQYMKKRFEEIFNCNKNF